MPGLIVPDPATGRRQLRVSPPGDAPPGGWVEMLGRLPRALGGGRHGWGGACFQGLAGRVAWLLQAGMPRMCPLAG